MFFKQKIKLLPKKLDEGVALTRLVSQHCFKFRGLKKLYRVPKINLASKIVLGIFFAIYFSGYQPTLAVPPIKQSIARAELSQEQTIEQTKLAFPFNLPHPGYLSTSFFTYHPGVDIATGLGMPIRPIAPGKIIEVNFSLWGLGHFVVVEHEQNFRSTYGHMGRVFVQKGDIVAADSILGEVGMTGHTSGPHTHLEVTKEGKYINPQTILPSIAAWPAAAGPKPQGQGTVAPEKEQIEKIEDRKIELLSDNYLHPKSEETQKLLSKLPRPLLSQ